MQWLQRVALLLLPLLVLVPGRPAAQNPPRASFPPAEVPPRNDIRVDNRAAITMRDGVILYADVYRPVEDGRYPVIVSRTPYSTERFPAAFEAGVYFSRRGYVYVFQDVRGRHESDGRWEPFFDDEKDGYDTIEWAARQPWSNGKVGMQGGSYLGQNQWRAAQAAPPSLVTIFPSVASTSIYHDWITLNGAWRLNSSPHSDSLGRPMKVGREEMVTAWLTAEKYSRLDFEAIDRQCVRQAEYLERELSAVPGLKLERTPVDRTRKIRRVSVQWDEQALGITATDVERLLMEGAPRIAVGRARPQGIELTVFMNEAGDEKVAVKRLREIFKA